MASVVKWNPFEALNEFEEDLNSFFRSGWSRSTKESKLLSAIWSPSVDIHEDGNAYYFDVEVPGVERDGFDVKIEDRVLTVKGSRESKKKEKDKNYHRVEREYGNFARSFSLPEIADSEKVSAEYKNGVLHLKVSKKEQAKPKQISVKVA